MPAGARRALAGVASARSWVEALTCLRPLGRQVVALLTDPERIRPFTPALAKRERGTERKPNQQPGDRRKEKT